MHIKREKFIITRYKHVQHTQTNLYYIIILYYYYIVLYIILYMKQIVSLYSSKT